MKKRLYSHWCAKNTNPMFTCEEVKGWGFREKKSEGMGNGSGSWEETHGRKGQAGQCLMARGMCKGKHWGRAGSAGQSSESGPREERAVGARCGGEMCKGLCPPHRKWIYHKKPQHNTFGVLTLLSLWGLASLIFTLVQLGGKRFGCLQHSGITSLVMTQQISLSKRF